MTWDQGVCQHSHKVVLFGGAESSEEEERVDVLGSEPTGMNDPVRHWHRQ